MILIVLILILQSHLQRAPELAGARRWRRPPDNKTENTKHTKNT